MRAQEKRLAALEEFVALHSRTIENALQSHALSMREAAEEASGIYNVIKDDAEARARQDNSFITTNGLSQAARILTDQADRDDAAVEALQHLLDSYGQE